jgi:hypothetical protein
MGVKTISPSLREQHTLQVIEIKAVCEVFKLQRFGQLAIPFPEEFLDLTRSASENSMGIYLIFLF